MPRRIRLRAEAQCWPLWWDDSGDNVDPHTLPLSEPTVERLIRWAETFDGFYDMADPAGGTEPSAEAARAFRAEGLSLRERITEELGPGFEVVYRDKPAQGTAT